MKNIEVTIDISAEELRKKLGIKDGENGKTPVKGVDYFDGVSPKVDEVVSIALDVIKDSLPTEKTVIESIKGIPNAIRNSLENLPIDKRLDISKLKGYDDLLKEIRATKSTVIGANRNLYQLLDVNATGIQTGEILKWDGRVWIPYDITGFVTDGYVPYVGATANVHINTKNYLGGTSINTPTGTSNLFLGMDDFWAINTVGNLYLSYISLYGKWYCPTSTAVPPTYTAGDSVVVIINNAPTYLTIATATPSVLVGAINGYILTFVEPTYTPTNGDQMNKVADATHNLNTIASKNSIILGNYNLTVANTQQAIIAGRLNTDASINAGDKLFVVGNNNTTKGGFYFGTGTSNTRTHTSASSNTFSVGDSNVFSGTSGASNTYHIAVGGNNTLSGTAASMIIVGTGNSLSGEAYVVGISNTMTGTLGFAVGRLNTVSGTFGSTVGNLLKSRAHGEVVLGHNSEDITALNATAYNALDWALRLGAGTGNTSPATSKDVFRIRKNGEINNYLQTATAVGQVIKLFTAHSGDAWQIQDVNANVLTRFTANGSLQFNANNIITDTTTGTKIGTATTQKLGFWNATPVVKDTNAFTVTNLTNDYSYDANATTIDEVADVLGTVINILKTYGLLS